MREGKCIAVKERKQDFSVPHGDRCCKRYGLHRGSPQQFKILMVSTQNKYVILTFGVRIWNRKSKTWHNSDFFHSFLSSLLSKNIYLSSYHFTGAGHDLVYQRALTSRNKKGPFQSSLFLSGVLICTGNMPGVGILPIFQCVVKHTMSSLFLERIQIATTQNNKMMILQENAF